MQTIAIQNTPASTPQSAKNTPAPNDDFKQALSRELDRAPVCNAPEPAPAAPAKTAAPKAQKPAQNTTQTAKQPDTADTAASTAQTDAAPAPEGTATAAATPAPAETDPDANDAAAAADAPTDMLAMLAAYQQLTAAPQAKADAPADTAASASTDAAQLAALQADAAGKRPALELDAKAEPTSAKPATDSTSALQQAQADKAATDQLAKLGDGDVPHAQLTTEQTAEAFASKLAEANAQPQPVLPQAAHALAATAQAAQAAAASQLQARVGTNAWEQQLGQKVVWMVAGGDQSASLTLNPPDLGPLQVVLNVSNDSATATFTAAQPETRQAIENALPKLREMMSEAGIALGNATVSAGTQDQQGAFADQARAAGGGGRRSGNAVDGGAPDAPQPVVRQTVLGAVDTFA